MALRVATEPAVEPISIDDLKNDIRVDSDLTADDALIRGFGLAARKVAELVQGRALITQTLELTLDGWPSKGYFELPRPPLQSVTSIKYYDEDDSEATVSADSYFVDTVSEPGRVVLNSGEVWPSTVLRPVNGIKVTYVAGYGDDAEDVPETTVQAIRLLVGHWYENREAAMTTGSVPKELPFGVSALLWLERLNVV